MPDTLPLDAVLLAERLVAIDSRNPDLVPGAPGEAQCAAFLADVLSGWGFAVEQREVRPGRPNVIARIGPRGAPPLVFNGHLDVVGTAGMTHPPFEPVREGGRLYGRGAADMKGGIAAMCVAAARAHARGSLRRELIVAAVCDEEFLSIGTRAFLEDAGPLAGAVVTEPTRLAICPAHKGFAWLEVTVRGRAAHGSRHDVGVDAVTHAGLLLAALDTHQRDVLTRTQHPLLGRGSRHAATITGGTGWSTYPAACTIRFERRTLPGTTGAAVLAEVQAVIDRLAAERDGFDASVRLVAEQPPSDLAVDAPLVTALASALTAGGRPAPVAGLACWTDAALFTQAGVPALCFGPGDIARAHAAEEWVAVDEIEAAADTLETLCAAWDDAADAAGAAAEAGA